MNEIIKVNYDSERPTVMGRELHKMLEIGTAYKDWFPRMCEYGFTENIDYNPLKIEQVQIEGNREVKRTIIDHQLTIEMAKEICMLQRSEKGKQARQYFIQLEQEWNTPEMVMSRALKMADTTIHRLKTTVAIKEQQIAELKPRADYTDSILQNKGLVTITQIAKDYGMTGTALNKLLHELKVQYKQSKQWLLYQCFQDKGYTHSETINITRTDGRPDIKMETKWTQKGRLFLYGLLKRNEILPVIERNETNEEENKN